MLLYALAFVIAVVVLARSSAFLVKALSRVGVKLKVSEYMVGFIIMAVATSLPELVVGAASALEGRPNLSLGNVVGANIANLTLILGLATLIAGGIRIQIRVRNREIFYTCLSTLAPLVMLLDGKLTRNEGFILLLFFALYIYNLLFQSREYSKVIEDHQDHRSLPKEFGLLAIGLLALLGSAEIIVRSGEALARNFGIPSILIGIFAISWGTTIPELAFSIPAAVHRQGAMVMGNLLGSVVTNATLVLGTVAIIHPIELERSDIFLTSGAALIITLLVLVGFIRSEYRISKAEALALVLGYLTFTIAELFFGMTG